MNYSDTLSFFFLKRYFFLYQSKPNVLCNYIQILCNLKSSDIINEYSTASSSCETDSACTVFESNEMGNHLPIEENIDRIEDTSISEVDNPNLDEAELPRSTTSCSQEGQTFACSVIADAMCEDKIADLWPEYPCLYDVRSPDFKNRDLRDNSIQEIAEKLGKTGRFDRI